MVQPTDVGAAPRTRREARAREAAARAASEGRSAFPAPAVPPSPPAGNPTVDPPLSPPVGISPLVESPPAAGPTQPPAPAPRRRRDLRRAQQQRVQRPRAQRPRVAFRPDVEGLRAVAVVLVVAFHARLGMPGGFIGVDVFFVISGFLITSLLVDEVRATGSISLVDFYARRARRILPAACLVLVVTALAAAVVLPAVDRPALADDVRSAALFVANWHVAALSTDYFAAPNSSLVLHYWSLSVEEQFYLVWPVLVLLVAGRRRAARRARRPASRDTDRRLWMTLAPIGLVSLVLSAATTASAGPWAYFGTHTRAWELAAGAAVALGRPHLHRLGDRQSAMVGWVGLVAVLVSAVVLGEETAVPGVVLLVPVAGAAAIVAAGAGSQDGAAALLGRPPLAALGRLSYSWYLWHWPCLMLARLVWAAPAQDDLPAPDVPVALRVAAVLLALGLAALTFRFVEEPARNARALRAAFPGAFPAAGALVAATVVIAVVVLPDRSSAVPPAPPAASAGLPAPAPSLARTSPAASRGLPPRLPASTPGRLAMTPAQARGDQAPTRDCFAGFAGRTAPADCRFGDPGGSRVLVLVGDSHAAAWFPAFDVVARRNHWQLWFWAKSGCGYAQVREFLAAYHREYTECSDWRRSTLARISALPRTDLVVVGRSISYLGELLDAGGNEVGRTAAAPLWSQGAAATFTRLQAGGRRVALLRDVPRPGFDVPACLSEHVDDPGACSFPRSRHVLPDAALFGAESEVLTDRGVTVVDLTPAVCPGNPCQVVSPGGSIVYRDDHHLTATFAREVSGAVQQALAPLLGAKAGSS